jgi:DNA repair protein RadC
MTPRRASKPEPATATTDEIETVINLVRENLHLLAELVQRYEVNRTEITTDGSIVRTPADVVGYLGPEMADLAQEQLRVVLLDTKNRLLGASLVYQGGINSIMVRLADFFREAVRVNAAAILLVHNHPSGDPEPSNEDVRVTREAAQVGELLGIDLLDHVILGNRAHVSLRERRFYRPVMEQQSGRRRKSAGGDRPSWEVPHA